MKGYPHKPRFEVALAIAAVIVAACGLFVVAMTLRMVVLSWSPTPFWDQWQELVSGRSLTWSWLIAQHNEHRLFVPRLIFWLDGWLAEETNVVDFAVSVLIQTALSVLLAWLALKTSASDRFARVWAYGLSFALLFWAVQYENFAWGFQVAFFGVGLAAAASFALVAVGPETGLGAAAAAVSAGAAVYTLASGILVPVLALILAAWVGRPRWYLLVLLLAAIGWPASYLWGYVTPAIHSNPAEVFSNFGAVSFHFLTQLGGPFFKAVDDGGNLVVAAVFGGVGLSLFLAALILVFLRPAKPAQKALAMFAIYLLGAALLTALGRVRFGVAQALTSRYATPVVAFWLSTFLSWFGASAFGNRLRLMTVAASVPLAILVATSEARFVRDGLDFALGRKLATPALFAGVANPGLDDLFIREVVLAKRSVLLTSRTSVFAEDWTRLMGATFSEHFAANPNARCSGAFLRAQMVDQSGSVWSATGTASLDGSSEGLRRLVLVNSEDRIVGYGLGGFDASSVGDDQAALTKPVWWVGSFADPNPAKVRAYAVLGGDHACLVGSSPRIFPPAIVTSSLPSPAPERAGHVDGVMVEDQHVTIAGWGYLSSSEGRVIIDTDLPIRAMTMNRERRPDVVAYLKDASLVNAGIEIRLFLKSDADKKKQYRFCVWTDDPKYGRRMLRDAAPLEGQPLLACDPAVGAARGPPVNSGRAQEPPPAPGERK